MKDLDEFKKHWNKATFSREPGRDVRIPGRDTSRRLLSTRDRLMRRRVAMVVVCLLAPLLLIPANNAGILFPLWVKLIYASFFAIMAVFQGIEIHAINTIDFGEMPVVEALERTLQFRMLKNRIQIISIILGVITLGSIFYTLVETGEMYALIGGWIGMVVGGAAGVISNLRDRRMVNEIIRDLRETLDDTDD